MQFAFSDPKRQRVGRITIVYGMRQVHKIKEGIEEDVVHGVIKKKSHNIQSYMGGIEDIASKH